MQMCADVNKIRISNLFRVAFHLCDVKNTRRLLNSILWALELINRISCPNESRFPHKHFADRTVCSPGCAKSTFHPAENRT